VQLRRETTQQRGPVGGILQGLLKTPPELSAGMGRAAGHDDQRRLVQPVDVLCVGGGLGVVEIHIGASQRPRIPVLGAAKWGGVGVAQRGADIDVAHRLRVETRGLVNEIVEFICPEQLGVRQPIAPGLVGPGVGP
jgi:hypothetical protein